MTTPALPQILAVATAVPKNKMTQSEVHGAFAEHFPRYRDRRIQGIFAASGIETRHFVLAREQFDPAADPDTLHAVFRAGALALGEAAARKCLAEAGLEPRDVDYVVATTCTGYLCPGLSPRLAQALGMRDDVQRADLVGMGCAGAMPSLQRASDFVRANQGRRALVVTVEVSSACWYVDDSLETVVGNTICADGAAAVVVGCDDGASGPRLECFSTLLDFDFIESVGFEFKGGKNRIVLAKQLRTASGPLVRRAVERLLAQAALDFTDVDHWIVHSGGKRVLDAIGDALDLRDGGLAHSRAVLRDFGNMSSPTLLFVLDRVLDLARSGDVGVLVALGPGLAAETGVLRW